MYGIFRSLVLSEIAIKHIDVYGIVVVLNKRLSQEFVRKSLANCFIYVKPIELLLLGAFNCSFSAEGTSYWLGYLLHRDNDLPAIVTSDDEQQWYQHGKIHRDNDQPAIIDSSGDKKWYQHGELHRDNDRPAYIGRRGRAWYLHGKRHREDDRPARIDSVGIPYWFKYDERYYPK